MPVSARDSAFVLGGSLLVWILYYVLMPDNPLDAQETTVVVGAFALVAIGLRRLRRGRSPAKEGS